MSDDQCKSIRPGTEQDETPVECRLPAFHEGSHATLAENLDHGSPVWPWTEAECKAPLYLLAKNGRTVLCQRTAGHPGKHAHKRYEWPRPGGTRIAMGGCTAVAYTAAHGVFYCDHLEGHHFGHWSDLARLAWDSDGSPEPVSDVAEDDRCATTLRIDPSMRCDREAGHHGGHTFGDAVAEHARSAIRVRCEAQYKLDNGRAVRCTKEAGHVELHAHLGLHWSGDPWGVVQTTGIGEVASDSAGQPRLSDSPTVMADFGSAVAEHARTASRAVAWAGHLASVNGNRDELILRLLERVEQLEQGAYADGPATDDMFAKLERKVDALERGLGQTSNLLHSAIEASEPEDPGTRLLERMDALATEITRQNLETQRVVASQSEFILAALKDASVTHTLPPCPTRFREGECAGVLGHPGQCTVHADDIGAPEADTVTDAGGHVYDENEGSPTGPF